MERGARPPRLCHSRTSSAASGIDSKGAVDEASRWGTHEYNGLLGQCSTRGTSRSISLNSVSSDGEVTQENPMVEQEEIIALTHDVRGFKEALGKLRRIFHPDRDKQETVRGAAHERLGEVLRILRSILEKYAPLQSTELLMAAGQLIQQIKGFNFENVKADPTEFFEAIDQLALAFSSRVSEYLMGDLDTSSTVHPAARSRSCENLRSELDNGDSVCRIPDVLSPQQIDELVMRLEHGVSLALQRAKIWSKYAKDVLMYIEKRASLEAECARNVLKLANTVRPMIKEEGFLPFQSIYCSALDQDMENANLCQATCSMLQGHKFVEPLTARRNEHEKVRKQIKDSWQREMKRMQDTVSNLRKARSLYYQRQLEYEKARDALQRVENLEGAETSKLDKKKKLEDDALQKAMEAETTYKACVVEANERHQILQKVKAEVLKQVRELMLQCDQTLKAVTVGYFQLQHTVSAPAPVQFQTLCEGSRLYEPGTQYMEYVKTLPVSPDAPIYEPPPYSFEPYVPTDNRLQEKERRPNGVLKGSDDSIGPSPSSQSSDASKENKPRISHPVKSWSGAPLAVSDSDSISSQSNKSVDTSPYSSPQIHARSLGSTPSDDLDLDNENADGSDVLPRGLSKAASTHALKKLKTPSRCRECDTYVYFQGLECSECMLSCHKKCAETLAIQCGHKRLKPKLTTFGVDLTAHIQETQTEIPHLITRCIQEIDERGIGLKGIYRVSGVKSKVEKLCQSFENGVELVDLTEIHPNIIANVLKLYLRQLPEPLLTYRLYPEFVYVAKMHPGRGSEELLVEDLKGIVRRLPRPHYATLAVLMQHLRRVTEHADINNMPASNLGIVFGPTLLRTSEGGASLSSLIDTVHQTRVIELLILLSQALFGSTGSKVLSRKQVSGMHQISSEKRGEEDQSRPRADKVGHSEDYEHFSVYQTSSWAREAECDASQHGDDYVSGSHSDEELPDNLLPDDSESKRSPLIRRSSTQSDDFTADNVAGAKKSSRMRTSLSESDAILQTSQEVGSCETDLSSQLSDVESEQSHLTVNCESSPPVAPPRRHLSQQRLNRISPAPSDCDSASIRSVSPTSGAAASNVVSSTDRIVIHVQGESNSDPALSHYDLLPCKSSDDGGCKTDVQDDCCDFELHVDSATDLDSPCSQSAAGDSTVTLNRPVPSLRLSRLVTTVTVPEVTEPSSKHVSGHAGSAELTTAEETLPSHTLSLQDYTIHHTQQPSPVSSIPSTSSSMDELDDFASNNTSTSPSPNEYVSPYLTGDPYKNLRFGNGSPLTYGRTTTFANYEEPCRIRVTSGRNTGDEVSPVVTDDVNETLSGFSRMATRTSSLPTTELGSRNSILRTATRHQRYSPAYSTSSTKSSGSSSSPPPEMAEADGSSNAMPKPSPRSVVLARQDGSSCNSLHRVSSDSSVFVRHSNLNDEDPEVNQKRESMIRTPRFV